MSPETRKIIKKRFGGAKIYRDGFRVSLALHRKGSGKIKPVVQEKPWGAEVWLIFTKRYASKILFLEKGKRFSLQRHNLKEESWLVNSGQALVTINNKKFKAGAGSVIHVGRGITHRVEALSKLVEIWEVSTPQLHDAVRLADDFARMDKKYNPR